MFFWPGTFNPEKGVIMQIKIHRTLKYFIMVFFLTGAHFSFPGQCEADQRALKNSIGMEFLLIPGGTFTMGSPPAEGGDPGEIQHKVTIGRPFYIQKTEVTLGQWRAVMGRRFFFPRKGEDNMPVVRVSWYDCVDFIERLNKKGNGYYRLPTEAEWEYACRAGSSDAYAWGDVLDCTTAMFCNNSLKGKSCVQYFRSRGLYSDQPAPVGSFSPNAWGIYDMHGNVWEWCHDRYGDYPENRVTDPCGPKDGTNRVRRGGSWFGPAERCRSANRNSGHPASRFRTTGFRLIWCDKPDCICLEEHQARHRWIDEDPDGP